MNVYKIEDVDPAVVLAVATAKTSLVRKVEYMFFANILFRLNLVYADVKTLATDGVNLFVDPAFIAPLTNREIAFCLMHETLHVIYDHVSRLGTKNHDMWNSACDYVVNGVLDDMNMHLPSNITPLLDHKYDGMNADQVYAILDAEAKKGNPPPPPSYPDIKPNAGKGQPDSNGNPMQGYTPEQVANHVKGMIDSAMVAAQMGGEKSWGNVPASIKRDYEERMRPVINWKDQLSEFMFAVGKEGRTFKKPSRRGLALGATMPGRAGKGLGRIDFSIDTSGSVSHGMFVQFVSEIAHVFDKFKPKCIGISQFDHDLKSRDVINNPSHFKQITFKGGGGTNIEPVMEMFKEVDSKALIVLTDGYFYHTPEMNPGKPVVWCIYDNPKWKPPFGRAVHFKLADLGKGVYL